jgi:hypothetical protein
MEDEMLKALERLGERMLSRVVPGVTAGASCNFYRWCELCPGQPVRHQWCTQFGSCAISCDYCTSGYC